MPFKDLQKSRESHREAMRKKREGVTLGVTNSGGNIVTDRRTQVLADALINPTKYSKLILISNALDKEVTGLDGSKVKLNTMVRYGIGGFTFSEIAEVL